MFKCNYLDKLKDKTFQKHKCKKGAKFGKRVEI